MPRGTVINSSNGHIGDVRYSRLSEAQFQSLNGPGWVLYDDRDITGSALHAKDGTATLEDHRGLYPRAKNNGRADGNQNPAGDLAIGTYQEYATQEHIHRTTLWADDWDAGSGEMMDNDFSGSTGIDNWQSSGLFTGRADSNEVLVKTGVLNAFIKINH